MSQYSSGSGGPGGHGGQNRKGEPLSKKSYTLKLTFSTMVTASIVLIIGIGWSFVLGVMVGRGYNPEKKVPQLATLLPQEDQTLPKGQRESLGDTLPRAEVMKPEELRFASTLKGKPGQAPTEQKPKNMQNATMPVTAPPATPAANATAPVTSGIVEQAAPRQPKVEAPSSPLFDFVFQVATFKDEASVDKLRTRLEGAGMRTRMDKDGKLLKVLVLMRGTNEQGQDLRQRMVDMGLGQPIQRAKKPVAAGKKR